MGVDVPGPSCVLVVIDRMTGRAYSFGNRYDPTFSHTGVAVPAYLGPRPVGSFPIDESPFGIRDTNGGVMSWCFNLGYAQFRGSRPIRGGSWNHGFARARSATTSGNLPTAFGADLGFRLAACPIFWEA